MKRVLIVAYYYPPQPRAGALRPSYLAANLHHFGWEPTILTVVYGNDPVAVDGVVRVPQLLKTRRLSPSLPPAPARRKRMRIEEALRDLVRTIVYFPDDASSWYPGAVRAALELLRDRPFKAVISTSPPPTAHFIARRVSGKARIPWLADYRDLWSGRPSVHFDRDLGRFGRALAYPAERWLLKKAGAITVPTESHRDELVASFGRTDVVVIPNACDLAPWQSIPDIRPAEFSMCFTGAIHPGLRTPDPLFEAAAALRAQHDLAGLNARFDFYGNNGDMVADSAARFGIGDAVRIHGEVERFAALRAQRSAAVLILLLDTGAERGDVERGNPGSKIYEYIGARRPVLAIGSNDNVVKPMLSKLAIGRYASDVPSVMLAIRAFYADFIAGLVEPPLNPEWRPYTPLDLARDFATVLERFG
jgi:glycosyltransferase involved in cell wall biosynthesis